MAPGSWATAPSRCIMPYGRQCRSCNRVGGADGVLMPTRNRLSTPVSRPDAPEGGTRVRPTCLWSCAHVRVPWIRARGTYREALLQTLPVARPSQSVSLDTVVHAGLTPVHDPSLAVLGAVRLSIASHALDEGDAKRRASRRLTRTASLHQLILLTTVSKVRVGVVELKQLINVGAQTLSHSVLMGGCSAKLCEAAMSGDTAEVRRLVRSGENVDGHGGGGPLHAAARTGHAETAKALLELGATANGGEPRWTPLHTAAQYGHAGDFLMLPATGSPTQCHAPTQRREVRECVSHHCGAVCMCVCHELEQGGTYRETLLQTLPKPQTPGPVQHSPHWSQSDPSLCP
jgi:hypothetical protein